MMKQTLNQWRSRLLPRSRKVEDKRDTLAAYPALRGVDRRVLADIASWADEIRIDSGETVVGLGGPNRWSYLVANPEATVIEAGQARAAGAALGLAEALRAKPHPTDVALVACDPLELLAIPPTRLDHLIQQVPRLAYVALEETKAPAGSSPCVQLRAGDPAGEGLGHGDHTLEAALSG